VGQPQPRLPSLLAYPEQDAQVVLALDVLGGDLGLAGLTTTSSTKARTRSRMSSSSGVRVKSMALVGVSLSR
jgi:hypothetical protein